MSLKTLDNIPLEDLQLSYQVLSDITKNTPDIIYVKDLQGTYLKMNGAGCQLLGKTEEEIIGKTNHDLLSKDISETIKQCDRQVIEENRSRTSEETITIRDMTKTYLVTKIPHRNVKGDAVGLICIARDITDLKKTQKILSEKNIAMKEILGQIELEKKEVKEYVVSNINRFIFPMLRKAKNKVGDDGQEYFQAIEKNLQQITESFGHKIGNQQLGLTPTEMEVCNMIKNGFSTKDIALMLNVSPLTIETHRNRIRKKIGITNKSINLYTYLQSL